jgi:hypothetical protein
MESPSRSRGTGAGVSIVGTATQQGYARYGPCRLRAASATTYAAAANRTFGEPTTPFFCISAFRSSEPNQVRAFATSETSCRITTSFGSWALRNTLPFVINRNALRMRT